MRCKASALKFGSPQVAVIVIEGAGAGAGSLAVTVDSWQLLTTPGIGSVPKNEFEQVPVPLRFI